MKIDDLSAIEQEDMEQSQLTYEQSKPQRKNVFCPQPKTTYNCPICDRLRAVCPYTKLRYCEHQSRKTVNYESKYQFEKSNNDTLPQSKGIYYNTIEDTGTLVTEHMQTQHNHQKTTLTPQKRTIQRQSGQAGYQYQQMQGRKHYQQPLVSQYYQEGQSRQHTQQTQGRHYRMASDGRLPQHSRVVQEIIYYPVIHNKLIFTPTPQRQKKRETPLRQKDTNDGILTPSQFKLLVRQLRSNDQ